MDSHPGWHNFLSAINAIIPLSPINLLNFSVLFLFAVFAVPPVFLLQRPEAWITSLLLLALCSFSPLYRLFYGRPFIISMLLVIIFCLSWDKLKGQHKYSYMLIFIALSTLSTWIHGVWYLLFLPIISLLVCKKWRSASILSIAFAIGTIIGALLTGKPITFLHQMLFHAMTALGTHDFQRQLVTEFQPFNGDVLVLVLVAGLLLWRMARGKWTRKTVENPAFVLGVIGWILGFIAARFWTDWGWPAMACWVALEIQAIFDESVAPLSLRRCGVVIVLCVVFFLAVTNDYGGRWSSKTILQWPRTENAEQRPWLPGKDGILYSDSMSVFYNIFFQNPYGSWRYILGFEPGWMPAEDLEIYRRIQLTRGKDESYIPWIEKMTVADRMILVRMEKPKIGELEWHEVAPTIWSGRLISKNIIP